MSLIEIIPELRKESERIHEAVAVIEELIKPQGERPGTPPVVSANQAN